MIDFENPAAFLLLIIIPVLYLLRYLKVFTGISFPMTLSDWKGSHFTWNRGIRKIMSGVIQTFCVLGFVCVVIAFANPVVHHQEKVYISRGADILFVLDTSPSMAAKDIADMRRLDAAKQAIHTLATDNTGDAIGLVEMGKEAAAVVPLTLDRTIFFERLDNLAVGEMGDGTAIGTGLSCAIYHLAKSSAPKKCIVLITDGENNAGSIHPLTAAKLAHDKNVTLYILGIGSRGTVPLEYVDPKTGHVYSGFLDSNYDTTSLTELATAANGKFFSVETVGALSMAINTIGKHENVVQNYRIRNTDENFYSQLLLVAGLLFAVSWLLRRVYLQEML